MIAQGSFFPAGLTPKQSQLLDELVSGVDPTKPELYLSEARQHIREAEAAAPTKPQVNLKLGRALASAFENVMTRWSSVPGYAQVYLCGAMKYFASYQDEIHDFDSFVGFEDDVEVLNSCLELAGLVDLKINPEDFDGV